MEARKKDPVHGLSSLDLPRVLRHRPSSRSPYCHLPHLRGSKSAGAGGWQHTGSAQHLMVTEAVSTRLRLGESDALSGDKGTPHARWLAATYGLRPARRGRRNGLYATRFKN